MHCAVQPIPCIVLVAVLPITRPAIASHNLAPFNPGINPGIPGLSKLNPEIPGLAKRSGIAFPRYVPQCLSSSSVYGPQQCLIWQWRVTTLWNLVHWDHNRRSSSSSPKITPNIGHGDRDRRHCPSLCLRTAHLDAHPILSAAVVGAASADTAVSGSLWWVPLPFNYRCPLA